MAKTDDEQLNWILDHASDMEFLVNSPGWKALCEKAVEDISGTMETMFMPTLKSSSEDFAYAKGYVAGIKSLMNFPEGAVNAAKQAEDKAPVVSERRKHAMRLAGA